MNNSLCIFGFGYTAGYLAIECKSEPFAILGTSRKAAETEAAPGQAYQLLAFSAATFAKRNLKPTHLLISTPPAVDSGDPVLKEFASYLHSIRSSLQWVGYLSSTSVYGDHQGRWVDENTPPENPSPTGKLRLAAEKAWLDWAAAYQLPCFIFRIAGIYGPYRNALRQLQQGKAFSIFKKDQVFSRIHVEDLARVIKAALLQPEKAGIYNVSDQEPAPAPLVDSYAAALLGLAAPPLLPIEQATLSAQQLEFYQSNRRVSNLKIQQQLGLELHYPTYREGLKTLLEKGFY
jgi:nucleoside-diphosphate-sugar epimerase